MKFVISGAQKFGPRVGVLTEIGRFPNVTIRTPSLLLYTKGGNLPHVTNEVFKLICTDLQIIQIPFVSTYNFKEAMAEFNGTIAQFVGMDECLSCLTVQDPGDYTQPGHHVQDNIPLWTRNGKVLVNATSYMDAVELFKPDMYYLLSDGDTSTVSKSKRVAKAVSNTIKYFKECTERHEKSKYLKNSFAMASIAGGYCLKSRKECIDAVSGSPIVGGFLIDGLHNNGPEVELIKSEEIEEVVNFVLKNLPESKLRAVHGGWNPVTVLKLVELGVDIFDTSYCYIATERCCALTFSFESTHNKSHYEINLKQPIFADDFSPIVETCECLTCLKYSKSYVHHLLSVDELLGPLLLTIHNIHHYLEFFKTIQECIENSTFSQLKDVVQLQYEAHHNFIKKHDAKCNEENKTIATSIQSAESTANASGDKIKSFG